MIEPLDHSTRYDLMKSDQVPADQLAEWLKEPGFAAYVEGRNASMAARQAGVNAPAPSADAVIAAGSAMANILYNLKQTTIGDERLRASMKKCQEDWDKARSLATIPAAEPAYWAVHSRTGMHIGLWPQKANAEEALREYEGGTITALFSSPQPTLPVVKPLEWRNGSAHTLIDGMYVITKEDGYWILERIAGSSTFKSAHATEADAQAFAQSKYDQSIRSALVAPQPARETEAEIAAERDRLNAELKRVKSDREYVIGWNDGYEHAGGAPAKLQFPTMLRKMWSGQEVQQWIDDALAALRAGEQP